MRWAKPVDVNVCLSDFVFVKVGRNDESMLSVVLFTIGLSSEPSLGIAVPDFRPTQLRRRHHPEHKRREILAPLMSRPNEAAPHLRGLGSSHLFFFQDGT